MDRRRFGRALAELDIELILARSPQAKGRVERFFETAQDGSVKEMRLAKVKTREQANALLEEEGLIADFNRPFCSSAGGKLADAHRALGIEPSSWPVILSLQFERVVSNDYTVHFQIRHLPGG